MRTPTAFLCLALSACSATSTTMELATEDPTAPVEVTRGGTLVVLNKSDATVSWIAVETGETLGQSPTGAGPHEVAMSPDGATAVVCDYGQQQPGSTLTVLDVATGAVLDTIRLGRHARPHGIQFQDARHLLVTVEQSRAVLRVDLFEGRVSDVFATDADASHMLVMAPDASRVFVANIASGSVTAIDLATGEILAQIPTGRGAEGLDITPDGRELWVGNRAEDTVTIIDARTLEIEATLPCATFPIRVKITPDGRHALVSNAQSGDVAVFDVAGRTELRRIPMELQAEGEVSDRLFGDRFGQGPVPIGILIEPSGRRAFIANTNVDMVTVLDLEQWSISGRLATGKQPDGLGYTLLTPEFTE